MQWYASYMKQSNKLENIKKKKLKMHKKRLWGGRDLFPLYGVLQKLIKAQQTFTKHAEANSTKAGLR